MKLEIGKTYYSEVMGSVRIVGRSSKTGSFEGMYHGRLMGFFKEDGTCRAFEYSPRFTLRELHDPLAARFIALWLTGRIATHDGPGRVMIRVAQPEGGLYRERWEATARTLDEAFELCGV